MPQVRVGTPQQREGDGRVRAWRRAHTTGAQRRYGSAGQAQGHAWCQNSLHQRLLRPRARHQGLPLAAMIRPGHYFRLCCS